MIEKIIENAIKNNPVTLDENSFTGDDGLIYCRKCGVARQCRITLGGEEMTVPCICKCEKEAEEQEKVRERERDRLLAKEREINKAVYYSFPKDNEGRINKMRSWTFENDDGADPETMKIARNYIKNFDKLKKAGKGLLLWGDKGTGKTYTACCIANTLLDNYQSVLLTSFSRVVNELMGMYDGKQRYIDELCSYDLLIIDDLGVERETGFMREQVFNIIDTRYRTGLPIIVTTNLTLTEISSCPDTDKARIYSRLLEMTFPVEVNGSDRRKQAARKSYNEIRAMLTAD